MSDAANLLSANGMRQEADEMIKRVFAAGDYHEALRIISEYVETEISSIRDQRKQEIPKQGKKQCR